MATWAQFADQAPDLSRFVHVRFDDDATGRLSFLATLRGDGGPRVHPVKVFVAGDHAWVFMWGGSPKGADLQRDGRFALHTAVTPNPVTSGEAAVRGTAFVSTGLDERRMAAAAAPFAKPPSDDSVLFRLEVDHVIASFARDGAPMRLRWREQDATETVLAFPTDN